MVTVKGLAADKSINLEWKVFGSGNVNCRFAVTRLCGRSQHCRSFRANGSVGQGADDKQMRRVKRTLWLVGTIIFLALLAGGGWIYYTIYLNSDFALRHAEAFLFRRMTVAQRADEGTYRFFFATNRKKEPGTGPLESRFVNETTDALTYGTSDVRIRPTLGIGMLINPSEWFESEQITPRAVRDLDQAGFIEQLRSHVENSPHRSLLVLVHGFRSSFPLALRKTAFFGHVLDINTPVLMFDWPGDQGSSLAGYRRARRVAAESGAAMAQTLELVIREVRPERLWLVANSLGAQVVVDAFSLLYQQPDLADAQTEFQDVVLTAPDVDHKQFNLEFKDQINALARDLAVYVSSNDRALVLSRLVNRSRRLGESTLSPAQISEAEAISELMDPDSDRISLIDVTPINRTRNFHNFSLETPEFFDDLFLRLTHETTPQSRLLYPIRTAEGQVYWVLTRGR